MGGFFGAVSHEDVTLDIFFGVDYHSHLGTRRGGMLIHDAQDGFQRQIHSIENTPFRTKFEKDLTDFHGCSGIGCISDTDPQPLLVRSHLGLYAITTVGIINNSEELIQRYFSDHGHQFMAMSSGKVNATELAAALINQKDDLVSGILHAQEEIRGSLTLLILTSQGEIIAARDQVGRLPVLIGKKEGAHCVSFESFAYHKLGYTDAYELGPREIVRITANGIEITVQGKKYPYEVFSAPGEPDLEWRRRNTYKKFYVQYDPYDMSSVRLLYKDKGGAMRFECVASFPLMIHRAQQEQTEAEKRFIRAQQEAVINERINRQVVAKDIEYEHGVAPEQNGLRTPDLKGLGKEAQRQIDRRTRKYSQPARPSIGRDMKVISNVTWDSFEKKEVSIRKVVGKL